MKHIRDFHSQSWNNPFFARQAGLGRLKKALIWTGLVFLLVGLAYVFVYSPFLRVQTIEIAGNETISADDIRSAAKDAVSGYRYLAIPNDHLLTIDQNGLTNSLLARFPTFRQIDAKKQFGKLSIIVEERKPTFRLLVADKSYLLDQEGRGMKEAGAGEGDALIAVSRDGLSFVVGNKTLPDGWADKILEVHKYFATLTGVRDRLIGLDPADGSFNIRTNEDWYVIIDPSTDIKTQIESLSSALLGKFNFEERKRLEYVDVRYGDRIFYKWR